MTTGHVYIATSLDGFVARADHQLDWLNRQPPPSGGSDMGYAAFTAGVDGLVMGRGTFETVLGFDIDWPYDKPVVVASRSLHEADVPDTLSDRVRVSALAPAELMADLDARGWKRAYIDGGQLVQSFLREGLIEDLTLTTVPVLIGEGKRLFGPLGGDIDLELVKSEAFDNGMVQTTWRIK